MNAQNIQRIIIPHFIFHQDSKIAGNPTTQPNPNRGNGSNKSSRWCNGHQTGNCAAGGAQEGRVSPVHPFDNDPSQGPARRRNMGGDKRTRGYSIGR